ncbi:MAG TPA: hypothetical protein PLX60_11530 [Chitinophagales bacterium]|nr:hypothetical protein [Chitinophagales bacterium]
MDERIKLKQEIHNIIDSINDEEILNAIYTILKKHHVNAYVDQYNKEIDESMNQYKNGNFTSQEELEKKLKS